MDRISIFLIYPIKGLFNDSKPLCYNLDPSEDDPSHELNPNQQKVTRKNETSTNSRILHR